MKVIFLDHDGVICLQDQWGSRFKKQNKAGFSRSQDKKTLPIDVRFDDFDKKAIKVLNEILEETGAEIVVSSDWKQWASVDELGELFKQRGIIKKPIDTTPFFKDVEVPDDFKWTFSDELEQSRSLEIKQWLKEHPEVDKWVAVDDLSMDMLIESTHFGLMEREWGLKHFIWTPVAREGIKQSGIKKKIIDILNK